MKNEHLINQQLAIINRHEQNIEGLYSRLNQQRICLEKAKDKLKAIYIKAIKASIPVEKLPLNINKYTTKYDKVICINTAYQVVMAYYDTTGKNKTEAQVRAVDLEDFGENYIQRIYAVIKLYLT